MKFTLRELIAFLIQIISLVFLVIIEQHFLNYDKFFRIKLIALLGFITIGLSIFLVYKIRKKIDSYIILLFLIYIFMFGQQFLFFINIYPENLTILSGRVSDYSIYKTGFLILKSLNMLNIGYLIANKRCHNLKKNLIDIDNRRESIYKAGLIFFSISLLPTLIVLSKNIYLTYTVGYAERMMSTEYNISGIQNIMGILSSFMVPSLLALFISRDEKKKWPVYFIAIYIILYTASGSRINTMILLIGVLFIQTNLFTKINLSKIFKYFVTLFIVFMTFTIVPIARANISSGESVTNIVKDSFNVTIEKNIIVSALAEAGYTFSATATVVDNTPVNQPYNKGISYLSGLAYIFPNGVTDNFYNKVGSTDDKFKGYLNIYGGGIGSSFIAEAYWNFGYYSLIVMLLFGVILGGVNSKLENSINNRDYKNIFVYTFIFVTIAFYVRSDTRTFFRNYIWFCLPIILVSNNIKAKLERGKN